MLKSRLTGTTLNVEGTSSISDFAKKSTNSISTATGEQKLKIAAVIDKTYLNVT